ncbi:MAG: hypothetical protein JSV65_03820 [Armatimonadota bacterium]|nr:MAG: hypothetical protein JSV65_03820 [Armatimonadota bacterium]
MACPLYSTHEQECLLLNQAAVEDDEDVVSEADRLQQDFCLGTGNEHLACPIYRRRAIERTKAY